MSPFLSLSSYKLRSFLFAALILGLQNGSAVLSQEPPEGVEAVAILASPDLYIVQLENSPLLRYRGEIEGLPSPPRRPALRRNGNGEPRRARLDTDSWQSQAYLSYLERKQNERLDGIEQELGREVEVRFRYRVLRNGVALAVSADEASRLRRLPGVRSVTRDSLHPLQGHAGADWIGSADIWEGTGTGGLGASKGEGIIIGIIDSGINSNHPSFGDSPPDGHTYTNPLGAGTHVGVCDPLDSEYDPSFPCNEKLIGAWDFADDTTCESDGPEDDEGHGSHVASIAAGNALDDPPVSGVAPHANLITYDACYWSSPLSTCYVGGTPRGLCAFSSTLAAADQAVLDQVDVLNISIAGGQDPWSTNDINSVLLDAHDAGLLTVASAANSGPDPMGVTHAGPWVLTVAATSHDRLRHEAELTVSGGDSPPSDLIGASMNRSALGPRSVVYAGDYASAIPSMNATNAANCVEPFDPGTFAAGEIVVCEFFGNGQPFSQMLKSQYVANGGAGGAIILANSFAPAGFEIPTAFPHAIPTIQLDRDPSATLETWLASGSGHMATIGTSTTLRDENDADLIWERSSRGPLPNLDLIKPDIGAPGGEMLAYSVPAGSILAADGDYYGNGTDSALYNYRSGTSMASPHAAGAAALLMDLHPDWSPSEVKSALMTTAETSLTLEDRATPATPFDVGSGRIELRNAARAGLVLDETTANYAAADPDLGGDPATLNLPSMQSSSCAALCQWQRAVESSATATVTWTATTVSDAGTQVAVIPPSFQIAPGATQVLDIEARVLSTSVTDWQFGRITLTPSDGSIPAVTMPVAFFATGGAWGDLLWDGFESGDQSAWDD